MRAILTLLIVTITISFYSYRDIRAESTREKEEMDLFLEDCANNASSYDATFDVRFAPIRRLVNGERLIGQWRFTFANDIRGYEKDEFRLKSDDDEIHFVSSMHAKENDSRPEYIWHVISIPVRESGLNTQIITGYTARYNIFQQEQGRWDEETYRHVRRSAVSTRSGNNLMYLNVKLGEDIQFKIKKAWEAVFKDAMKSLVIASGSVGGVYVHTFYYHDVLSSNFEINPEGDRRNSSKKVHMAGDVFGFVIDDKGACIASARLSVVDK